jgi:hypothetical protein
LEKWNANASRWGSNDDIESRPLQPLPIENMHGQPEKKYYENCQPSQINIISSKNWIMRPEKLQIMLPTLPATLDL